MKVLRREFQGKYRIDTVRLKHWNYGWLGWYFVTICTKGRMPWFGDVIDGRMVMSPAGIIAADEWLRTPAIRPYVHLDEWVIMPDHLHGIIVITPMEHERRTGGCASSDDASSDDVETRRGASLRYAMPSPDDMPSRHGIPSIPPRAGIAYAGNTFGPQSHNLASIIRGFKAAATVRIRSENSPAFSWQPRFYEHIIRDHTALENIRAYIRANPSRWRPPRCIRTSRT